MKTIHQMDALEFLSAATFTEKDALVASIPDVSEMPSAVIDRWVPWFTEVAETVISKAHPETPIIFYQSDIRHSGAYIDKGYLVQKAAEKIGATLLQHRIVCRKPPGTATFGRATYSHLLMFSKELRNSQRYGYPDVVPDGGPSAWVRGIGLHACEAIVRMIKQESGCETLVHLFCGKGLLLEVAREEGLHVVGVDLSKKQCRAAQRFDLPKFKTAIQAASSSSPTAPT